jgi:uncharacterized Zn-finger protein
MSGHAGNGLHYHGLGAERYGHVHHFLHINHEHETTQGEADCPWCGEVVTRTADGFHVLCINGHEWWDE